MSYLLKIKTKDGYTFKVLVELIQKYLKDGCFVIDKKGISLTGVDTKTKSGTKLICVDLPRTNFTKYKCEDEPFYAGLNMMHFYRILKSIKKKDTLIMYVRKDNPLKLYIKKLQVGEDEDKAMEHNINITQVRPHARDSPTNYGDPIIATAKEFQKLKSLNRISKIMSITGKRGRIRFTCDKEDVYSGSVPFGDIDSDDEEEEEADEEEEEYNQSFESENIIDLVKLGSTSNNIQIYTNFGLPLRFKMNAGPLGTVDIYIKSKETLEEEQEEDGGGSVDILVGGEVLE
jgi:hypothetical protein